MEQLFLVALIPVVESEIWRQRDLYEGICTRNETCDLFLLLFKA
jgi:hypothetical protein